MKHLILVLFFVSCAIHLVPAKNQTVIDQVTLASSKTNTLYDNVKASRDKSFPPFASQYSRIDIEIDDILFLDSARSKSKIILKMMNDLKNIFLQFEADHKSRVLNNSELTIYQDQMNQAWKSVYNAEINFK